MESLHPDDFDLLEHPGGGGVVQPQHVPHQELPVHVDLLPLLQSPASTSLYSEREREEISILAQQISSLASSFDLHHSLNVVQHEGARPAACDWHHGPEPVGEHTSMLESILKDLSVDTEKNSPSCPGIVPYQPGFMSGPHREPEPLDLFEEDLLSKEPLCLGGIAMDPFSLQLGHHNLDNGLHQLNICMQSRLQQGELSINPSTASVHTTHKLLVLTQQR